MLRIHHSNRIERLLDRLAGVTAEPLANPFTAETVIVPNQGMARWIAFGLAARQKVAANIDFALPAAFVWRLFRSQLPEIPDASGYDRQGLTWRLMRVLPELLGESGFEPLARYLEGPRPERRRFQLCRRIADLFDQYLVYRPDLLLAWEAGEESDFDARLWRALTEGTAPPHRARLIDRFLRLARAGRLDPARLPPRIALFAIPTLPPAYLELLARLGEATEVNLFLHNPCAEYWGDIESPRAISRRRRAAAGGEDYRVSGNRLLASWGRQGRDFMDALLEYAGEEEEAFEPPAGESLLARLQGDILALTEFTPPPLPDPSLRFHLCHSPMREVEVLLDELLALFDADPTLSPREVVVMMPEVESYAPYIEAVLGAAPEGRRIPYAINDLSRRGAHPVVRTFLTLLDLGRSRFTAGEVLSLLEVPAVLRRFRLDEQALETLRGWVREAQIRWGLDGPARAEFDLPAGEAHTWRFGLRRLFLGYALPPREALFAGVLPYPHVEGQAAAALGRLQGFLDELAQLRRRLARPRTAADWAVLVNELLEGLFDAEGEEGESIAAIRTALADLVDECARGGFEAPFGLDVLADDLKTRLAEPAAGQQFLTGQVTFCAMVPMRSLPFRVICLLGMNDAAFPRREPPAGFDRMARSPRRGDRSRREDDRYLFLEALLSARERLLISYVGRSQRDNSPQLPSVLVSELQDYLREWLGEAGLSALITEHPLQPFSERNFGTGPLFSYAAEWLPGLAARAGERGDPAPFCPAPLAAAEAVDELDLADLIRFFADPARAFLRGRLGLKLEGLAQLPEDDEPFALDHRTRRELSEQALAALVAGESEAERRTLFAASGRVPEGAVGALDLDDLLKELPELASMVAAEGGALLRVEVELELPVARLSGWLDGVGREGLVRWRSHPLSARDRLGLYLEHLALSAVRPGEAVRSRFLTRGGRFTLGPVAEPGARLAELIALYLEGQSRPLPLFPRSAEAFTRPQSARARTTAAQRARGVFYGSDWQAGEGEGPWVRIAFRGVAQPLGEEFERIAATVFGPLWAVVEEES